MPERIQRQRTRGWRMPEGAVYVGRTAHGLGWGNPFRVGHDVTVSQAPGNRTGVGASSTAPEVRLPTSTRRSSRCRTALPAGSRWSVLVTLGIVPFETPPTRDFGPVRPCHGPRERARCTPVWGSRRWLRVHRRR